MLLNPYWLSLILFAPVLGTVLAGALVSISHAFGIISNK